MTPCIISPCHFSFSLCDVETRVNPLQFCFLLVGRLDRRREERREELCSPPSWLPDCSLKGSDFPPETLRLVGKILLYSVRKSGHSQRCNDARSPSRWGLVQGMDYIMIERSHSGFSRWEADLRKEGLPGRGCNFSNSVLETETDMENSTYFLPPDINIPTNSHIFPSHCTKKGMKESPSD